MHARVLSVALLVACVLGTGRASATHEPGHEWVADTAYTLNGGELSLGILRWEVGILDEITVGTLPALWAVWPWLGSPVANGFVKVRDWVHGPVAVSLTGSLLHVDGSVLVNELTGEKGDEADLLVLRGNFAGTWRTRGPFSFGLGLALTALDVGGSRSDTSIDGTVVNDTLRASALIEWRLSRTVALHLNGYFLLLRSEPVATATIVTTDNVQVDAKLSVADVAPYGAWTVVPSFNFSGDNINFMLGAGYGYQSLPVVDVVLDERGLVVTGDFFVRFSL